MFVKWIICDEHSVQVYFLRMPGIHYLLYILLGVFIGPVHVMDNLNQIPCKYTTVIRQEFSEQANKQVTSPQWITWDRDEEK